MKHEAFLSYARVPDLALATALERSLQAFAKPWNRVRAIDIFRDQSNLSSIGGLARGVSRGLDESEFLILLACPESAKSYWVTQELTHWLQTKSTEKIVLVLTGGTAHWDRATGDFDWEKTTAFPDCLRGRFAEEPIWLDLTWAAGIEKPSIRDVRFLNVVGDISAIVRGVSKEQLIGEDVRQHRKLVVLQRAAIAALLALTVTVAVSALAALQQRNRAVANADRAEAASKLAQQNQALAEKNEQRAVANEQDAVRQRALAEERRVVAERERAEADRQREQATLERNRAQSRALASTSLLSLGEDVQLALNLAVEAVRVTTTAESEHALRRALVAARALDPDRVRDVYWDGSLTDAGEPIADVIKPFHARARVGQTLVSADGRRTVSIAVCCSPTVRETIDAVPRVRTLTGHTDTVEAIAFDPTGRFLVSGSQDQTVRVWDASTGQQLSVFPHDGQVVQVAFSADGSAIIASSRRTRRAWESRLGRPAGALALSRPADHAVVATKLNDLALSPRRDLAAIWGWHGVVVVRTDSFAAPWNINGGMMPAFSPDARELAIADLKGLTLYGLAARSPRARLETGDVIDAVAYSVDSKVLATAVRSGPIHIWDTASGARSATLPLRQRTAAIAFDRQGRHLAVVHTDGAAVLLNVGTGKSEWSLPPAGRINRVWFGPGDRWLMFVRDSGSVRVVDRATGRDLAALAHRDEGLVAALNHQKTGLALGSEYIYAPTAIGSRAPVTVWNLANLTPVMTPERTLSGHSGIITSLDFSPDGRWLVTGGLDDAVLVWDLSDGEVIDSYRYSAGGVFSAAFGGDGRHVVVADRDGNVALHDCVPCGAGAGLLAAAQERIVRPLSAEQRRRYLDALTVEHRASVPPAER